MSSGHEGRQELRVLCSRYGTVHFLLNRSQCSTSMFASGVQEFRSRHRYMKELLPVGEAMVLLLDLHRFWCDTFHVTTDSGTELAVIAAEEVFSEATRRWLRQKFFPQLSIANLSCDRLAFRIPSDTVMLSLRPDQLSLHDRRLEQILNRRGILALHLSEDSLGYLIDIEALLRSRLLFSAGCEDTP